MAKKIYGVTFRRIREHGKLYCGPAALSALTGRKVEDCTAVINRVQGKDDRRRVRWLGYGHIEKALTQFGFKWEKRQFKRPYPKLRDWIFESVGGKFLVVTTNHYIAVGGGKVADSIQWYPRSVRRFHSPGCWVTRVYKLEES